MVSAGDFRNGVTFEEDGNVLQVVEFQHVTHIAKKSGYADVCGIAAPSEFLMQANNMLREFMGVMKDFLVGNI